eukprot:778100_1
MAAGTSRASKNTSPGMNLKDHLSEQKRLLHTELDAVACEKENLGRLRLLLHRQCEKSSRFGTMDIDEIIDIPVTRKKSLAAKNQMDRVKMLEIDQHRPAPRLHSLARLWPFVATHCLPVRRGHWDSDSACVALSRRSCACWPCIGMRVKCGTAA